jgi:MFS family permease
VGKEIEKKLWAGIYPSISHSLLEILSFHRLFEVPKHSTPFNRSTVLHSILAGPELDFFLDFFTSIIMSSPPRAESVSTVRTYAGLKGRPLGLLISTIATTGFLLFGYDQGVMSGIISAEPFNNYFPSTKNDSVYQGFVTAIYEVGCLIGAIFILTFGDRTGRRRAVGFILILRIKLLTISR